MAVASVQAALETIAGAVRGRAKRGAHLIRRPGQRMLGYGALYGLGDPAKWVSYPQGLGLSGIRICNTIETAYADLTTDPEGKFAEESHKIFQAHRNNLGVIYDGTMVRNLIAKDGVNPYAPANRHLWVDAIGRIGDLVSTYTGIARRDEQFVYHTWSGETLAPNGTHNAGDDEFHRPASRDQWVEFCHWLSEHLRADGWRAPYCAPALMYGWDDGLGTEAGLDFPALIADPNVDVVAAHVYSAADEANLPKLVALARKAGVPIFVEETGIARSYTDQQRADYFTRVLGVCRDAGVDGVGIWAIGDQYGNEATNAVDWPLTGAAIRGFFDATAPWPLYQAGGASQAQVDSLSALVGSLSARLAALEAGSTGGGGGGGTTPDAPVSVRWAGMNLAGAEFETAFMPSVADVDYLLGRGYRRIRLPFLAEREPDLTRLAPLVDRAVKGGAKVVLDMHNYGIRAGKLLGAGWSVDEWAQQWVTLASHPVVKTHPDDVELDLMNEPHDLPSSAGTLTVSKVVSGTAPGKTAVPWGTIKDGGWKVEDGASGVATVSAENTVTLTLSPGYSTLRLNDSSSHEGSLGSGSALVARMRVVDAAGSSGINAMVRVQDSTTWSYNTRSGRQAIGASWTDVALDVSKVAPSTQRGLCIEVNVDAIASATAQVVVEVMFLAVGSVVGASTGAQTWESASNTCVSTLRSADVANYVWLEPHSWASARSVASEHPGGSWCDDPRTIYSPHGYLDRSGQGTYANPADVPTWAEVQDWYSAGLDWLDAASAGKPRPVFGETAWPLGEAWAALGSQWLDWLRARNMGAVIWASGAAWQPDYPIAIYRGSPMAPTGLAAQIELRTA